MAHLGAWDSYDACGYILLLFFWLWTSIPFGFGFLVVLAVYLLRWAVLTVGRDTVPILGAPNPREASALLGAVSLDTKNLGISCLRF